MALDNYTDLLAEGQDWLWDRSDVAAKLPTCVTMFEAKVNRKLFVRQMEARSSTTVDLTAAQPEYLVLPSDFQTMRRIHCTNAPPGPSLRYATPTMIAELRDSDGGLVGPPEKFTLIGGELEIYPVPDQAYNFTMSYRQFIPSLTTADTGINWLFSLAPDAYLFGMLEQASLWLEEDERAALWKQKGLETFAELQDLGEKSTYNAGPLITQRGRRGY